MFKYKNDAHNYTETNLVGVVETFRLCDTPKETAATIARFLDALIEGGTISPERGLAILGLLEDFKIEKM